MILYQIQTKFRDEARPRAGLLRGREFLMKDSYSFDLSDDGLAASYQQHRDAYIRVFDRLGLDYTSCRPCPARWAAAARRSSSPPRRSARTRSSAAPAATTRRTPRP